MQLLLYLLFSILNSFVYFYNSGRTEVGLNSKVEISRNIIWRLNKFFLKISCLVFIIVFKDSVSSLVKKGLVYHI